MPDPRPLPLASLPAAAARAVRGVLTDIDDTLTTDGAITADALQALAWLKAAGLPVIAITGRPQGWSEPFALQWPVDAIVAENGAVSLRREEGRLRIDYQQDAATLARNALRLEQAAAQLLAEVPGATLARDSPGRVTDIAIDHSEFARLSAAQIGHVVAVMQRLGLHATVSSIHVNGWFGEHDKPDGARWIVKTLFGRELDAERDAWLYVGDSTNDQAMFEFLPLGVGVANLRRFADQLQTWPAFITQGERGAGFAEVAEALLAARS
jgi:HAD superfamily hydrolase (TIGR01484 family)